MTTSLANLIETRLLPFVEKPMRYVGNEVNILRKDPNDVTLRGVLCFPDLYDIGMSHHGLQILYHCINSIKDYSLCRAFMPWADAEYIMRKENIPLYDLENTLPLAQADWIGFSVQYELQYTNILAMLDLAHIPLWATDRTESDPLILCGGPCMGNPEPIAPFIDACVIGDGEDVLKSICTVLDSAKKSKLSRAAILAQLDALDGVYVPSLFPATQLTRYSIPAHAKGKIVHAAKIPVLSKENYPNKPLVPLVEVVHSRLAIEIMRGCSRGCRFCAAGMYYRPVRERPIDDIVTQISESVASSGWSDLGLLSLSSADYSALPELLDKTLMFSKEHKLSISLPSTRIDALTQEQIEALNRISPLSSCTIAPEAGSERLRRVINKDFTDEIIMRVVQQLLDSNAQTIKLYFMIGLPTETEEDIDAIVNLVSRIAGLARAASRRRSINVSISPFSPKAHTPFQWDALAPEAVLMSRGRFIKQQLSNIKNVKVSYREAKITVLESIMARGDRTIAKLIHAAYMNSARFDGWDECFNFARWAQAATDLKIDLDNYLKAIELTEVFPWSHISCGVTQAFLKEEREKASLAVPTQDCKTGACTICGICKKPFEGIVRATQSATILVTPPPKIQALPDKKFSYRVTYRKGKEIRFLGHRDMVDVITRSFIASRIPLKFSEGFSTHPKISFGPPLPLGAAGMQELFDVTTIAPVEDMCAKVNKLLPPGLKLLNQRALPDQKATSISASYAAGTFSIECPKTMSLVDAQERIAATLHKNDIIIETIKNNQKETRNIKPAIIECLATSNEDGIVILEMCLAQHAGCTARASEVLGILFPTILSAEFIISRTSCQTFLNSTRTEI